jgi:hypothetical protein
VTSRRVKRPDFSPHDKIKLLEALGTTRDWVIKCGAGAEYDSPRHRKCDVLRSAIDDVAEELTGDRGYFHEKLHSTPASYQKP